MRWKIKGMLCFQGIYEATPMKEFLPIHINFDPRALTANHDPDINFIKLATHNAKRLICRNILVGPLIINKA
jgi:hypothetical protein